MRIGDDEEQLATAQAAAVAGTHRNTWSSYVSRGVAPQPDGYTIKGHHPWWWRSTVEDFLRWRADPHLSRTPSPAERFANWQRRQAIGAALGGDPRPVDQSAADAERGLFTERHIRNHRDFTHDELVSELRDLVSLGSFNGIEISEEKVAAIADRLAPTEGDTVQITIDPTVRLT